MLTRHGKLVLTRHGKLEGMVDSVRKNLKGWLTRHGKLEGMVDSVRKTCVDSARKTFLIKNIYILTNHTDYYN